MRASGKCSGSDNSFHRCFRGKAQAHTPVMLAMKWLLFNPVSKHGTHPKKTLVNRDGAENIYLSSWNIQTWIASLKNNYSCLLWQTWKSSTLRKKIWRVKADDDVVKLSIKHSSITPANCCIQYLNILWYSNQY